MQGYYKTDDALVLITLPLKKQVNPEDLPTRIGAAVSERNYEEDPILVGRLRLNGFFVT